MTTPMKKASTQHGFSLKCNRYNKQLAWNLLLVVYVLLTITSDFVGKCIFDHHHVHPRRNTQHLLLCKSQPCTQTLQCRRLLSLPQSSVRGSSDKTSSATQQIHFFQHGRRSAAETDSILLPPRWPQLLVKYFVHPAKTCLKPITNKQKPWLRPL